MPLARLVSTLVRLLPIAVATSACTTPRSPPDPYADLADLGRAVGDAKVVALGEPAHAEGNMFEAMERIVHYLHERKGFNVVAWESGLWSCETDPEHCFGPPWAGVKETQGARHLSARDGIRTTGFDLQMTGTPRERALPSLRAELRAALATDAELADQADAALERFPKWKFFTAMTPAERDRSRTALSRALDAILAKHDPNHALLQRAVENVVSLYDWHEAVGADVSTKIDWNRGARLNNVRDKAMAENVLWLLRERYPGQKIVLWMATLHAARDLRGAHNVEAGVTDWTGYRTTGSWLAEALGSDYVALGLTAYGGKAGGLSGPAWIVAPAPDGSLEAQWAPASGFRFLGRRDLGADERVGRFFGLSPAIARWGTVLDGGLVFRDVTPVTPEGGGS